MKISHSQPVDKGGSNENRIGATEWNDVFFFCFFFKRNLQSCTNIYILLLLWRDEYSAQRSSSADIRNSFERCLLLFYPSKPFNVFLSRSKVWQWDDPVVTGWPRRNILHTRHRSSCSLYTAFIGWCALQPPTPLATHKWTFFFIQMNNNQRPTGRYYCLTTSTYHVLLHDPLGQVHFYFRGLPFLLPTLTLYKVLPHSYKNKPNCNHCSIFIGSLLISCIAFLYKIV